MMKIFRNVFLFTAILSLVGCASLAGENTRTVKVDSTPAGAEIIVDNQTYGVTPATITLPSYIYGGKTVTLRKEGYKDQTMTVNSKFQPIALLDVFLWPTFIIDAATGDLVKIDPAHLNLHSKLYRA